jgi:drug/metabolite transporter (DMT)-like permease
MPSPSAERLPASRQTFAWFLLISANALWAVSYVAAKYALLDTSVIIMLALRMGISALVLLPFLIAGRKNLHLTRQLIPQLLMLALIGFVINKLL